MLCKICRKTDTEQKNDICPACATITDGDSPAINHFISEGHSRSCTATLIWGNGICTCQVLNKQKLEIDFSKLNPHWYFCFYCGKQLFELCLGGLICKCHKTFVPIRSPEGYTELRCTNPPEPNKSNPERQTIFLWPDNFWIFKEDYKEEEYTYKSDDFDQIDIDINLDDEEIDILVHRYNRL